MGPTYIFLVHTSLCFVGHRYKQTVDFGYATLDILYTNPKDSGLYTCKATNRFGSAKSELRLLCSGASIQWPSTQYPIIYIYIIHLLK